MQISGLLQEGRRQGATDIHLSAGVPPLMRLGGKLAPLGGSPITGPEVADLVAQVLPKRLQADLVSKGQADFGFTDSTGGRCRANAYRERGTLALALRLLPSSPPMPEDLGVPPAVVKLVDKPHGMLIVTGPTGSGKSTTLASLIARVNHTRPLHIVTLEDPIEYIHTSKISLVQQREIGTDTESFASGLRAALRQDPDVILVGEMRDPETIGIALTAAETGHMVLATLHTVDASGAIDRIVDSFPPHQQSQVRVQLSAVLEGVVAQRLLARKDGTGRVAAFEVLMASSGIRNLIREGKTHQILSSIQTGRNHGMQTMESSLSALVHDGVVDAEAADAIGMAKAGEI